ITDMSFRSADARVDTWPFSIFERFRSHFDVFFYGPRKPADDRVAHGFRDLDHRIEISGAGDRKAGLDDVHSQLFQLAGDLDLFRCVQLATGDLFPVAQSRIEYFYFP